MISRQLTSGQELSQCSPKEKQTYLRVYACRYWSFVCRQAIKLRKLDTLNGPNTSTAAELSTILENTDLNDSSMFMSASAFLHNQQDTTMTTGASSRTSLGGSGSGSSGGVYQDFFSFYESVTPNRLSTESARRSTMAYSAVSYTLRQADLKFWDALIQIGSLNLVYSSIQEAARSSSSLSRLDEALEWFNIMETEEITPAMTSPREYSKYELDVIFKFNEFNLI